MTDPVDPALLERARKFKIERGEWCTALGELLTVEDCLSNGQPCQCQQDAEAIARFAARERLEAIEQCAKIATGFLVGDPANGIPLRSPLPSEIADAIRAQRDKGGAA